jgi:hypothetical protein
MKVPGEYLDEYDRVMAERMEVLRRAFGRAGIDLPVQPMRGALWSVALWGHMLPTELRFQDPESRRLIQAVERHALALSAALGDAWEYSGFDAEERDWPEDTGEKVNVCETFFSGDPKAECAWAVASIAFGASQALRTGRAPAGRGRPPLLTYYRFVRDLHELYVTVSKSKGFYEKDGTAHGPFVELVIEAQQILPDQLRLRERTTIANRVLQAFTVEIPE